MNLIKIVKNKEYHYSKYKDFDIIMIKSNDYTNGFINGTKMCHDRNKRLENWTRLTYVKKLLTATNKFSICTANQTSEDKLISGTYFSLDIIDHLIYWIKMGVLLNKTEQGYIYFITTDQYKSKNIYKVGYAKNIEFRLKQFNVSRYIDDYMYAFRFIEINDDIKKVEEFIHEELKDKRRNGEFFELTLEDINNICLKYTLIEELKCFSL